MFNLNKSATAIAAAMVGTIKTGDDASRFAQRALAEGHTSISDLIAADAVKQAVAIRAAIDKADPMHNMHTFVIKGANVGGSDPLQPHSEKGPEPKEDNPLQPVIDAIWPKPSEDEALPFTPLDAPAPPVAGLVDTTSTNTTTVNAGSVDVDSEGLPWDGRIHSSNKKKITKDNTWQLRRGIDAAVVEQVKAELRQVMAIPKHDASSVTAPAEASSPVSSGSPVQPVAVPAPPAETQGLHPETNAFSTATVNKLVEAGNTVPTAAAGTPQTGASSKPYSEYKLPDLMRGITSKMIQPDVVQSVVAQFGVPSVPALATRQDLIPLVAEALEL